MEQLFEISLSVLGKKALVRKSDYYHTILQEGLYSVTVDQLPLVQYFVQVNPEDKSETIKAKVYKTAVDKKWYDKTYSEEAESNSPEFGIPEINQQIKKAIDAYELQQKADYAFL